MGFGIRAELLCGRYTASAFNDRQSFEWPPHWARVYYALVDAWGADGSREGGRAALEWLELLGNPEIFATESVSYRSPVIHFVPVNDVDLTSPQKYQRLYERIGNALAQGLAGAAVVRKERDVNSMVQSRGPMSMSDVDKAGQMFAESRGRQARYYPTVRPADPVVVYWWEGAADPDDRDVLDSLLSQVVRLGHSSSFVSLTCMSDRPNGRAWLPQKGAPSLIRSIGPGLLQILERDYADHRASRSRTMRSATVRYRAPSDAGVMASVAPRPDMAGSWRVFQLVDPADPERAASAPGRLASQLTSAIRGAVLAHAPDARLPVLSGHAADGSPLTAAHASYLALPNVGHDRSTGAVSGLAIMMPDGSTEEELGCLDAALARWVGPRSVGSLGRGGRWHVGRGDASLATLDHRRWSRSSVCWVTATPVALGRFPAGLRHAGVGRRELPSDAVLDAAGEDIRRACGHVGLPEPENVHVSLAPLLDGAIPVRSYPPFTRGGVRRALVHAAISFSEPVSGPLILGSGRYLGLGLFLPVDWRQ